MKDNIVVEYSPEYVRIDECCVLNMRLADYNQIRDAKINEIFLEHINATDQELIRESIGYLNDRKGEPVPIRQAAPIGTMKPDNDAVYYPPLIRMILLDNIPVSKLETKYISLNYTITGIDPEYDYHYHAVFKVNDIDRNCVGWAPYIVSKDIIGNVAEIMTFTTDDNGSNRLIMCAHKNHIVELDRVPHDPKPYDY